MSLAAATRSEVTKFFTTAGWWILAIVIVLYLGSTGAGLAFAMVAQDSGLVTEGQALPAPDGAAPLLYSLAGTFGYVFPLIIGSMLVTTEFRHKTLVPTFLATPRRGVALTAKLVVGLLIGLAYGVLIVLVVAGPAAAVLAAFGEPTGLDDPDIWALLGRAVVALALWTLIGIGVGALVRNQVASIVIILVFTQFLEPILRMAASFVPVVGEAGAYLPGAASDAFIGQSLYSSLAAGGALPSWWVGGAVLLGYAVVLTVLGALTSWRRDVD